MILQNSFIILQLQSVFMPSTINPKLEYPVHSTISFLKKQIAEYTCLKNSLTLPLKLKMYFEMLETYVDTKPNINIPKQFIQNYKQFLKSFKKRTLQEKYDNLLNSLKIVEQLINKKQDSIQGEINYQKRIQQIQTTCYVRQYFMGLAKKSKRSFKFQNDQKTVKILQNKLETCFDLHFYTVRKSNKQKNALILQAIFQLNQIPQDLHKFYIIFKDKILSDEVYSILKNCILSIWKERFKLMIKESSKIELTNSPIKNCSPQLKLNLLNPQNISQYYKFKQKMDVFVVKNYQKLKILNNIRQNRIYVSNKWQNFYLVQKVINLPFQEVLRQIELVNKVPNKKLVHFQILQQIEDNISAAYFKYLVKGKDYEVLSICQDIIAQNSYTVIYRAIDNFISKRSIQFLQIQIDKYQTQKTKVKVVGVMKFDSSNKIGPVGVYEFLLGIVQLKNNLNKSNQLKNTIEKENNFSENEQNQEQFYTVIGSFEDDQERQNQFADLEMKKMEQQELQNQIRTTKQINTQLNLQKFCPSILNTSQNPFQINPKQLNLYLKRHYEVQLKDVNLQKQRLTQHYYNGQWAKHQNGGLYSLDLNSLNNQKKVFKIVLARMGHNLLRHKSIMNMSLPVIIFKPQSNLQTIARNLTFAPILFQDCIAFNPLQKVKNTILLMISMGTIGIALNKPFNPVIGETFQAYIAGSLISFQQISHHPPISSFYFQGRGYIVSGCVSPKVGMGLNNVKGYSQLPLKVQFQKDEHVEFTLGKMQIGGFLFGDRTFNFQDTNYIVDQKNKLIGQIFFGPNKKFTNHFNCQTKDFLSGYVYRVSDSFMVKFKKQGQNISPKNDKSSVVLSKIYGCWYQKIFMDDKEVFDFATVLPYKLVKQQIPLASDSTLREDIKWMSIGNLQKAQDGKDTAQQIQGNDQKLRQKFKTH